jgi:hypothetical protein
MSVEKLQELRRSARTKKLITSYAESSKKGSSPTSLPSRYRNDSGEKPEYLLAGARSKANVNLDDCDQITLRVRQVPKDPHSDKSKGHRNIFVMVRSTDNWAAVLRVKGFNAQSVYKQFSDASRASEIQLSIDRNSERVGDMTAPGIDLQAFPMFLGIAPLKPLPESATLKDRETWLDKWFALPNVARLVETSESIDDWLIDSGRPFTIGELTKFIKGTPDLIGELKFIRNMSINENGEITIHPIAYTNINNFVEKAEKEQSGVKSTITARLNLWDDPLIQAATSKSDFNIQVIRGKRMTIYLGIPIKHLDRLAPLMNMFIQLFINAMTKNLPAEDEPYKVLVILDEFCALGRMDKLKSGFGFLAGYNVHLMAIIQNVGQFYDVYGGRDKVDVFF